MSIKTILLHMANDPHRQARLAVAVETARRFEAHLHILYAFIPGGTPAAAVGRGASHAYLAEARAVALEKAATVESEVRQAAGGLSWSWEVCDSEDSRRLLQHANLADLAIVGQSRVEHLEDNLRLRLPDRLALEAACQTLIVPQEGHLSAPGERLLIAWRNSRPAGRAVRDALPFLVAARQVTVLSIAAVDDAAARADAAELVRHLSRQGVAAKLRADYGEDDDAGEIILAVAEELRADGLVMGAFSRSRLREAVLGGATHHVLGHMRLPVFLSH